ncbi:HTTM domain-containing protein [Paracoccus caeni]|uniref:HTTM domain-containing protein n=1 Tax=Paracoccus caeni TaxID=657651 RepID=A0A934SGT7_9RHOB|nr:HTTM domain-containing protein [Paracoccus caeni]MBK4215137.1 HTTM domain-containing protein [Paracoccus caeni]
MATMTTLSRLEDRLSRPVAAYSLAVFRILFGALLVWDCWRFIHYDRIWRYWVQPDFHFSYPGFGWVAALPEPWIHLAWLTMGLAALFVMLGLFYRVAILTLTLLFTYFFLIDAAEYLNHFYLVLLYAALLCALPAAQVWSLDARRKPRPATVPYAAVFALRVQTEIVLLYAGLVKITPDWLRGEPLGLWLRDRMEDTWLEPVFQQDWLIIAACWAVIALHVLGAPLLMIARTRLPVFLIYCFFHSANAYFFNIGIFPWLTIAASTIFFAPDWPNRFAARIAGTSAPTLTPLTPLPPRHLPRLVLGVLALWIAVQIVLPVRGVIFDSETRWSGDGHRFSWRMRIYDRQAEGVFIVTDRDSGEEWIVDPYEMLTTRQADKMLVRADMVHQFANHLGVLWRTRGRDVAVRAEICKSLNGRPCQSFIDPNTDLTQVRVNRFTADDWVLPMTRAHWGVSDNRVQIAAD